MMNKYYLFLLGVFMTVGIATRAQTADNADKAIKMSKEKYDMGKIPASAPYVFYMEFTNISTKPVVIENVMAGCGCTIPERPQQPIMPGKAGKIKVQYNAAGPQQVNKDVIIKIAGINEPKIVYFTGEVVAKP